MMNFFSKIMFLCVCFFYSNTLVANDNYEVITDIEIKGNQRLDFNTIQSYINIKIGDKFDPETLNDAFKSLFATDLFSQISFLKENTKLIVSIEENPVINRVVFEGNKRLKDDDINAEILLKPRTVFTRNRVKQDLKRLTTLYRRSGRFASKIEPKVIMLDQNRVDLVFEIEEGPLTKISNISFLGNNSYTDSRLRREILLGEHRWWKVLSSSSSYDPDILNFDQESLRRFYLNEGFVDIDINSISAELNPEKDFFYITFSINEGERYKFGDIKGEIRLEGVTSNLIRNNINIKSGQWYNAEKIDKITTDITENVRNAGFPFVEVVPNLRRKSEDSIIDINFIVKEGPKIYVERINIVGNERTLDRIVRRNVRLTEGDAFNRNLISRSRTLITNLGHFSKVDIKESPGSTDDTINLEFSVQEQSTGELSFGAGYSSGNGALANIGISERNLFGKGQRIKLNFTAAQRTNRIDFSFMEPYFLDRNVSLSTDIFSTTREYIESNYEQDIDGGGLGLGYGLGEYTRQSINYRLEKQTLKADTDASTSVLGAVGEDISSKIGVNTSYDLTDNRFDPTEGYIITNNINLAGIGGDKHFIQTTSSAAIYNEILDEKVVFSLSGKIGYILGLGEDIAIADRFFIGNTSFIGFQVAGLGPRDGNTGDPLGGNAYFTIQPEFSFGVGLPEELGVKGRLFLATGTLTTLDTSDSNYLDSGSIRLSSGAGLSWTSPFGPIRIDYSYAILKESYDRTETISFNVGNLF